MTLYGEIVRALLGPWLLVAWTLFVWGTRIRNIIEDDELAGFEQIWRTGLAVGLTVLALGGLAALVSHKAVRPAITALAGVTVVAWVVRGISIAFADHSAAFIAIHLVLAIVSIGLSVWSWRTIQQQAHSA